MTSGIVFDIREFTVHDGPGIRTTVFLKGCPLACMWCHNPEGQSCQPQIISSPAGERLAGKEYSAGELAGLLNQQAAILREAEGGVTFSGGEPLLQAQFVAEVIDALEDQHVVVDTCGHAPKNDFLLLLERTDLFFFDLKLMDRQQHRRYTGMDNDLILDNLRVLGDSDKSFVIRVPLVPGVTDTQENLTAIAEAICKWPGLVEVNLLPYNRAAGAKYASAGLAFRPDYDEALAININLDPFLAKGIRVSLKK